MYNIKSSLLIMLGGICGIVLTIVGIGIFLYVLGDGNQCCSFLSMLYFLPGFALLFAPVGGFFGGLLVAYIIIPKLSLQKSKQSHWTNKLRVIIPLLILFSLIFSPILFMGKDKTVVHSAYWIISEHPSCDTQVVILVLTSYQEDEIVCSNRLLNYLSTIDADVIPITYRVTVVFATGEVQSYQLIQVADVNITWEMWFSGSSGCGFQNNDAFEVCDSVERQNISPLYESSWTD